MRLGVLHLGIIDDVVALELDHGQELALLDFVSALLEAALELAERLGGLKPKVELPRNYQELEVTDVLSRGERLQHRLQRLPDRRLVVPAVRGGCVARHV